MSVTIVRKTGLLGSPGFMTIKIDGQPDEKVAGPSTELNLESHQTTIQAKLFGSKSNSLPVKDGQKVEISTRFWTLISLILVTISFSISSQVLPSKYIFLSRIGLIVIFSLVYLIFPVYRLRLLPVIPPEN
ncbi:hypothetical protein [Marinilactibacillus sp. Marseille-P9653]|uniref:hypothetical protein n=1 Tax=Marinilactibacillus sp. Marseille-P9653 TaxID=2866583 RepID=UPI001CE443B3|nr:hypothetical protein [Marinilactibacillus sp. Marseille-P9653]